MRRASSEGFSKAGSLRNSGQSYLGTILTPFPLTMTPMRGQAGEGGRVSNAVE